MSVSVGVQHAVGLLVKLFLSSVPFLDVVLACTGCSANGYMVVAISSQTLPAFWSSRFSSVAVEFLPGPS
eukprot:954931-Amphidinium_carterae.2